MNVQRLIEEIRVRPALWDMSNADNKTRSTVPHLWKQVANAVGVEDVEQCKRKWKNLRDAYRALVRRAERRRERDKLLGEYDPNREYKSKWIYFDSLHFIKDNKRQRRRYSVDYDHNTNSTDDNYHPQYSNSPCEIKLEPTRLQDEEVYSIDDDDDDDDYDMDDDKYLEEYQSVKTTPPTNTLQQYPIVRVNPNSLLQTEMNNVPTGQAQTLPSNNKNCKCSQRSEKHVHFLENLEKEEGNLIASTQDDMKHSKDHTGDSDYNFLVSFLPQMKKMNDLQNLQFRSRLCDMVLNILAPTISQRNNVCVVPPPLTAGPSVVQQKYDNNTDLSLLQQPQSTIFPCRAAEPSSCADNVTINAATSTSCNVPP